VLHLEHTLLGAENWTFRKVDKKKIPESSEIVMLETDGDQLYLSCEK